MTEERFFWISLPYATFGVGVTNDVVAAAAPIAKWVLGKPASVLSFYRRKGAEIVEITQLIKPTLHTPTLVDADGYRHIIPALHEPALCGVTRGDQYAAADHHMRTLCRRCRERHAEEEKP